jgi:O-antigen/teichoic acid export membrane protein
MGLRATGDRLMDATLVALVGGNLVLLGVLLYMLRRLKRLREMKDQLTDRDS